MSDHLAGQSISRCVLGEPTGADLAHLAACAQCRGEVDQFEQALGGLRGSVRQWSRQEFAAVARPALRPVARPIIGAAWSMAVILLLSVAGVRSYQHRVLPPPVFADSDSELMDEIRADMDRPVPRGMEPLQALP